MTMYLKALEFAKLKHNGQKRKYTNEPYWTHPKAVADMLDDLGCPEEVVIAGMLHDTIEDTKTYYGEILTEFNPWVANLVMEVTDQSKPEDGNRAARKAIDLEHLSKASFWGATIKLADMIDNSRSIVQHDPGFAKVYLEEKAKAIQVLKGHKVLTKYAIDILTLSQRLVDYEFYERERNRNVLR